MEKVPEFVSALFILTTFITLYLFSGATSKAGAVWLVC